MKKSNLPKLNVQHEYISLKLPVGTFTVSFRGSKVSGELVLIKGAFESLDKYVVENTKTRSTGEVMNDLLNPKLLDQLVPGWNNPKKVEKFVAGDKIKFTSDLFAKKYPGTHDVKSTKGKYVYISIHNNKSGRDEVVGFPLINVAKVLQIE